LSTVKNSPKRRKFAQSGHTVWEALLRRRQHSRDFSLATRVTRSGDCLPFGWHLFKIFLATSFCYFVDFLSILLICLLISTLKMSFLRTNLVSCLLFFKATTLNSGGIRQLVLIRFPKIFFQWNNLENVMMITYLGYYFWNKNSQFLENKFLESNLPNFLQKYFENQS
jgi:hypothetical protein